MLPQLEDLRHLFAKMSKDGFDTSKPLKWSFYFFDTDKEKLKAVYEELKGHGYRLEEIAKREEEEYVLVVSKIDILSAEALHKRNIAFNELAAHCAVALYDGWDVEKI